MMADQKAMSTSRRAGVGMIGHVLIPSWRAGGSLMMEERSRSSVVSRIEVLSRVGTDGVLRLNLPLSSAEAGQAVRVIVEPTEPLTMTREEWHAFIDRTAGSITDPTFCRWDQGEYEERDPLP
jgi:hypothetical protein